MTDVPEYLSFSDRDEWRAWLSEHYADRASAWVAHSKVGAREPGLRYDEAVEEALCFGWVDGMTRRLDAERFVQRYSPRKPGSIWAESNKRRVERLIADGRMTEAGLAKVLEAKANGEWDAAARREDADTIPPDLEEALRARPEALAGYRALPASRRKQLAYWVESARREDTRRRRVAAVVAEALGRSGG